MDNSVIIHSRDKAWAQLSDESFLKEWQQLYDECPWATPFQSSAFVCTWFDNYRSRYSPVIISLRKKDHRLHGLLVLAMCLERRRLVVAGVHHAEYQVWLATTDCHADFIARALTALDEAFLSCNLVFKYLPNEVPVQKLLESGATTKRVELKIHQRPLMRINNEDLEGSFSKKSNKSRFNRLKRLGELKFERITDYNTFAAVFDQIVNLYDFRQGAVNNSFPFLQDVLKKPFHLDLMKQHPELLHVTLTTLDSRPIAAHIGIVGKDQVHLAILTYSPFYASYSPGKLHLMLMGRQFVQEGFKQFDLTPGGDPWKERFANCHDEVYELILYKSKSARTIHAFRVQTIDLIKEGAIWFGITPDRIRFFFMRLKRFRLSNVVSKLGRAVWKKVEFRIYRHTKEVSQCADPSGQLKKDYLPDLLKFEPAESWQTKEAFMAEALQRLERGEHVYTYASDECLLHYGWLIEQQQESFFTEVQQRFQYPEKSAVLYDFYTHPAARGRGFYQKNLKQMLGDVGKLKDVKHVYISVLSDNGPSRHVIEKLGFEYQCSLFHSSIFGSSKKWTYYAQAKANGQKNTL